MDPWLLVLVFSALAISVYTWVRLFVTLRRMRRESNESYEIAVRLQDDWQKVAQEAQQNRRHLLERFKQFESDLGERVDQAERLAGTTRERLIKLEKYLKEFFEIELKSVFESFDNTVASILEEMKVELLRGVERIEDIQAVVDSKSYAQDRILDGEGSVYRMIADSEKPADETEGADTEEAEPQAEEEGPADEATQDTSRDQAPRVALDPPPSRRLRADEGE